MSSVVEFEAGLHKMALVIEVKPSPAINYRRMAAQVTVADLKNGSASSAFRPPAPVPA